MGKCQFKILFVTLFVLQTFQVPTASKSCYDKEESVDVNLQSKKSLDFCLKNDDDIEGGSLILFIVKPEVEDGNSDDDNENDESAVGTAVFYYNPQQPDTLPSEVNHSEQCTISRFFDTCLVTEKQLSQYTTNINIQISCKQGPCIFRIRPFKQKETQLNYGTSEYLSLSDSNPLFSYNMKIPKKSEYKRVILTIKSENNVIKSENLQVDFFAENSFDIKTTESNTRFINSFSSSDPNLCDGCVIPFVISGTFFKQEATLKVTLRQYQETTKIDAEASKYIIDYISESNQYNFYEFDLSNVEFEYLKISVRTITGTPKRLKAHFHKQPTKVESYGWDSNVELLDNRFEVEQLIIRKSEIPANHGKTLFVAVGGTAPGAYAFQLFYENSLDLIEIELGEIEVKFNMYLRYHLKVGRLEYKEFQNFLIRLEKQDDDSSILQLKLVLNSLEGNANMKVRLCNLDTDSTCKSQLFKNINDFGSNQEGLIIKTESQNQSDTITLTPDCNAKEEDGDGLCWYIVGIVSEKTSDDKQIQAVYSLAAQYEQGSITIKKNKPFSSLVTEDETHYFVFYLEDKKHVQSITFRVSSPNVISLVSRKCQIVTWDCSQYQGTNETPVQLTGKQIRTGAYYIGITGIEATQYILTAEVRVNEELHIVQLLNGQIYQSSVSTKAPITCFQYSQKEEDTLNVNIHGPKGKLALYVLKDLDEFPTRDDNDEISYNSNLQIEASYLTACVEALETSFAPKPFYYNKEYEAVDSSWMNETNYQDIPFTITLMNNDAIQKLQLNSPHYATIQAGLSNLYSILCDPYSSEIFISKQILSSGIGVYQNTNDPLTIYLGDSPYKKAKEYEINLSNHDSSTLKVDKEQLELLCQEENRRLLVDDEGSVVELCEIYILVQSNSESQQRYTLTVYKKDMALSLVEGHQYQYNLEHLKGETQNQSYMHFYFRPLMNSADINIFVHSLYGKVGLTVNLWKSDKHQHKSAWPFPGQSAQDDLRSSPDFVSGNHNSIHRAIQPSSLTICWPDCLLLISVVYVNDQTDDQLAFDLKEDVDIVYDDSFNIMCTQLFQEIKEGQKIEFSLQHFDFKYFTFHNMNKLNQANDDERLALSLMSFVGSGYFSLKVGDRSHQRIPHIEDQDYDIHSKGTYLEVSKAQINEIILKNRLSWEDAELIIEVGAFSGIGRDLDTDLGSKLEFSISYIDSEFAQIQHGVSHAINVKPFKTVVMQFFNYYYYDIKIKVYRSSGFGSMRVWTCKPPNEIGACVDDSKQVGFKALGDTLLFGSTFSEIKIEKNLDSGYCSYCTYIIEIKAQEQEINALVTVVIEQDYIRLVNGVGFTDYIANAQEKNQYAASFIQDDQIEFTLSVLNGDPQVYIDFVQFDNVTKAQIGPLNMTYYQKENHLTSSLQHFKVIIPPRSALLESQEFYNMWPMGEEARQHFQAWKNSEQDDVPQALPLHFIHDELYIVITSEGQANYTLFYTTGNIEGQLKDGQIHPLHLSQQQPRAILIYEHYDPNVKPVFEIMSLNNTDLSGLNITFKFIAKQSRDDYTLSESSVINPVIIQKSLSAYTYQLPFDFGLYEFTIENNLALRGPIPYSQSDVYSLDDNNINQLTFEALVSGRDIIILPNDREINGYLDATSVNYYETLVEKPSYALVEMTSCVGDMQFGYAQDYKQFLDENYTLSVVNEYGRYQVQVKQITYQFLKQFAVDRGILFMSVHSNEKTNSFYQVQVHFFKHHKDIPFGKVIPGNGGILQWEFRENKFDKVYIKFFQARCPGCKNRIIKKTQVDYQIYWSVDANELNMFGHCKSEHYQTQSKASDHFQATPVNSYLMSVNQEFDEDILQFELDLTGMDLYSAVYVGVKATIKEFEGQKYDMKLLYNTAEVPVPNSLARILSKNKLFVSFVIIGLIVMICLLVLMLCLYSRRFRKVTNGLQYELSSIKNSMALPKGELPTAYENLAEDQSY